MVQLCFGIMYIAGWFGVLCFFISVMGGCAAVLDKLSPDMHWRKWYGKIFPPSFKVADRAMPDDEIAVSYRDALDKRKQVKILADLNLCSEAEILMVLKARGYELPRSGKVKKLIRNVRPKKWSVEQIAELSAYAQSGVTLEELSRKYQVKPDSMRRYLYRFHIPIP